MSKMIQLRNVPDDLHRRLKVRAAREGRSLSDYLISELRAVAARPAPDDLRARLASRTPVHVGEQPADAVRAERVRR